RRYWVCGAPGACALRCCDCRRWPPDCWVSSCSPCWSSGPLACVTGSPGGLSSGSSRRWAYPTRKPAARAPRRPRSVLEAPSRGELAHHALLLVGQLVRDVDRDLDNEVAPLAVLFDSLPRHPKPLARRSARGNANRHLLALERAHTDA